MILKFFFALIALGAFIATYLILTNQWTPSFHDVALWTAVTVAIVYGHLASEEHK